MTFQSTVREMVAFGFMALVTSGVLALLIGELARGAHALTAIAVYRVTASFGMEFLVASWPPLWGRAQRSS